MNKRVTKRVSVNEDFRARLDPFVAHVDGMDDDGFANNSLYLSTVQGDRAPYRCDTCTEIKPCALR